MDVLEPLESPAAYEGMRAATDAAAAEDYIAFCIGEDVRQLE